MTIYRDLRKRAHDVLFSVDQTGRLSMVNKVIITLILTSAVFTVVETEYAEIETAWLYRSVYLVLGAIFLVEYIVRVWSVAHSSPDRPLSSRMRYVISPIALIDLLAVLPLFIGFLGSETILFRLARLLRILRIARLGRFTPAFHHISDAVSSRRFELLVSLGIAAGLLLVCSTLLYWAEGQLQPEAFGSIPRAMWWSVATLTTVGYGDVTPITPIGRILAGMSAIVGIGLIAMPTGILAAAFSDAMSKHRNFYD